MVSNLPAKDHTEKVRVYVDNNDWRVIPFNEFRTVLGLSTEQADAAVKRLIKEHYLTKVSYGNFRKQKPPSPRTEKGNQANTTSPTVKPSPEAKPLDPPPPAPDESPMSADARKKAMTPKENRELIVEALQALRDLTPDGLTAEELHDLLGKRGRFETIRYGLKIAREQHRSVRIERCKPSNKRNNGRGYVVKHFWIGGCEPEAIFNASRALPELTVIDVASHPLAQGHPNMLLTQAEPIPAQTVAPAAPLRAANEDNTGYIAALKTRAADIEQLLKAVEPLNQELRLLQGVLALHHAD